MTKTPNALSSATMKVWKWDIQKVTPSGATKIFTDIVTVLVSLLFISAFPTPESLSNPALSWLCAAGLLVIMIYVFLPALSRICFGYYEHWIEE